MLAIIYNNPEINTKKISELMKKKLQTVNCMGKMLRSRGLVRRKVISNPDLVHRGLVRKETIWRINENRIPKIIGLIGKDDNKERLN